MRTKVNMLRKARDKDTQTCARVKEYLNALGVELRLFFRWGSQTGVYSHAYGGLDDKIDLLLSATFQSTWCLSAQRRGELCIALTSSSIASGSA
jgi:hypothetical protein